MDIMLNLSIIFVSVMLFSVFSTIESSYRVKEPVNVADGGKDMHPG